LLKNNKQKKQNKSFLFDALALATFRVFIDVFIIVLMLVYFHFKNRIIIEIDILKFAIAIFFLTCALCAKRKLDDITFYRILFQKDNSCRNLL